MGLYYLHRLKFGTWSPWYYCYVQVFSFYNLVYWHYYSWRQQAAPEICWKKKDILTNVFWLINCERLDVSWFQLSWVPWDQFLLILVLNYKRLVLLWRLCLSCKNLLSWVHADFYATIWLDSSTSAAIKFVSCNPSSRVEVGQLPEHFLFCYIK